MKRRKALQAVIALAIACHAPIASPIASGSVVFDPTNFAQNLISAQEAVNSTLSWANDYRMQAEMILRWRDYAMQVKRDAEKLGSFTMKDTFRDLLLGNEYYRSMRNLSSNLERTRSYWDNLARGGSRAGMTPEVYFWNNYSHRWFNDQHMQEEWRNQSRVIDNVLVDINTVQRLQQQIGSASMKGKEAELGLMNQHLNMVAGQLNTVVMLTGKAQMQDTAAKTTEIQKEQVAALRRWDQAEFERQALRRYIVESDAFLARSKR